MKKLQLFALTLLIALTLLTAYAQSASQLGLPEGAKMRLGKGRVYAMQFSLNGTRLKVASSSGIRHYDTQTGQEAHLIPLVEPIVSHITVFSSNGGILASTQGSTIRLLDAETGEFLQTLTGHTSQVSSVAFSPNGKMLASGGGDRTVRLWDVQTGELRKTLTEHTNGKSVAFSPDGRTLASSRYRNVHLWDVQTGELRKTLTDHRGDVRSVAFSPDGRTLASESGNFWMGGEIRLWDAETGKLLKRLTGHKGWATDISFSPDGRTLAIGSGKTEIGKVHLWDVEAGELLKTFTKHKGNVNSISFSPNGRILASEDREGTIRLWDVRTGKLRKKLTGHTKGVYSISFSPDGKMLASGSQDRKVRLWDVRTGKLRKTLIGHTSWVNSVAFSPNGKMLASGGADQTVRLWDVQTRELRKTLTRHTSWVSSVAFSPNGKMLASGSQDKTVRLWNVQTGELRKTLTEHTSGVTGISFSPNGKMLASGSQDKTVRLWNVQTGELRKTLTEHKDSVLGVAFSPDGKTVAGSSRDGTIQFWNAHTGKHKQTLYASSKSMNSFVFSPDGNFLAITDGFSRVMMLDLASNAVWEPLGPYPGNPKAVTFSPDGTTFASGGSSGTVILWDVTPYASQLNTQRQRDSVRLVYFRPSDRTVQQGVNRKLQTLIKAVQRFYAIRMRSDGQKTFSFEADADGNPSVIRLDGKFTDAYYQQDTFERVEKEVEAAFDTSKHVYLVAVDVSSETIGQDDQHEACGVARGYGQSRTDGAARKRRAGGLAVIPASGNCFNVEVTAHELGHAFGLDHDFRDNAYVMSYGIQNRLSKDAAIWLSAHRYFNTGQTEVDQKTTLKLLSPRASEFKFQLTDADGLHQVQLLVPVTANDPAPGTKLYSSKGFNGQTRRTVVFTVPALTGSPEVTLQVIDVNGHITRQRFPVKAGNVARGPDTPGGGDALLAMRIENPGVPDPTHIAGDINADGIVNLEDMNAAAAHLGQTGENIRDVNNDGVVDVADLLLIAAAIEAVAAAPALVLVDIADMFTAAEVRQWLLLAQASGLRDPVYQQGFLLLEQLLVILTPKETALLANYPNPFNPETWIPYHLSEPADVRISIYAADGHLVRVLILGHQGEGIYESRNRAAYWDGRNALGEPLASGVYFYTFTAGDFTATRKMLIRK